MLYRIIIEIYSIRLPSGFNNRYRVPRIDGWDEAFDYLGEKPATERLVVAINEFPCLVAENDSLPSYLQSFLDEQLQETDSMLVLCGSSVSTMQSEVIDHESPLYGRRTGQIDVQPFSFRQARDVIAYDIEDAIRSSAVTGGTPMYLTLFDYDQPLPENIQTHLLSPTARLYNEPEFLLRTELRNRARYMSILEAIATGHMTPNEISGPTGIDSGPLSKYLQTAAAVDRPQGARDGVGKAVQAVAVLGGRRVPPVLVLRTESLQH